MFKGFEYVEKNTFFHKLHPIPKIGITITIATLSLISNNFLSIILLFLLLITILWSSKVLKNWLLTMKSILLLWLLIIALNIIYYDIFWGMVLGLKFLVLLSSFSVLFQITSIDDFADALIRLHIPPMFAFLLSTSFRLIPTLAEEDQKMTEALKSRCLDLEAKGIVDRIRNNLPRFTLIFVTGIRRALQIAEAMECRAFGAKISVQRPNIPLKKRDKATLIITILIFLSALSLKYYFRLDI